MDAGRGARSTRPLAWSRSGQAPFDSSTGVGSLRAGPRAFVQRRLTNSRKRPYPQGDDCGRISRPSGRTQHPTAGHPNNFEENDMAATKNPALKELIAGLQEDLSREYQAIIAYTVYSNVLKGAQWMNIAGELRKHAGEELQHAISS